MDALTAYRITLDKIRHDYLKHIFVGNTEEALECLKNTRLDQEWQYSYEHDCLMAFWLAVHMENHQIVQNLINYEPIFRYIATLAFLRKVEMKSWQVKEKKKDGKKERANKEEQKPSQNVSSTEHNASVIGMAHNTSKILSNDGHTRSQNLGDGKEKAEKSGSRPATSMMEGGSSSEFSNGGSGEAESEDGGDENEDDEDENDSNQSEWERLEQVEEDSDSQNENQNEEEIEEKQLYSEDGVPQISIEDLLRCEDVLICHHEREFATMKG